jgi:OOP family OmpA-OmpF porin
LIGEGVNADQLTAIGRGEADPIADNDTAEGRAINRRVELVIEKLTIDEE